MSMPQVILTINLEQARQTIVQAIGNHQGELTETIVGMVNEQMDPANIDVLLRQEVQKHMAVALNDTIKNAIWKVLYQDREVKAKFEESIKFAVLKALEEMSNVEIRVDK